MSESDFSFRGNRDISSSTIYSVGPIK